MKCADLMSQNVEWLTETDSVFKAATVMAEAGIGFLPICDARRHVIGVVTDRDLTTRALAKRVDPQTTSAALVMSTPAVTCLATSDIREAEELMATERKARLVLTHPDGSLAGVLSLADLVAHAPRNAAKTIAAVLGREALGPRGGAPRGQPLLQDDPIARSQPHPSDDVTVKPTVFTGGHRGTDTKEFPG